MSTQKLHFRPSVQSLENRQLMAADVGLADVSATAEEPARVATITDITISGNTANMDGGGTRGTVNVDAGSVDGYSADVGGGGLWNAGGFRGGVYVGAADISGDATSNIVTAPDAGGGPHVKVFSATPVEPAQTSVADGTSSTVMVAENSGGSFRGTSSHDEFFAELGKAEPS